MRDLIVQFIWLQFSMNLSLSVEDTKKVVRNGAIRVESGDKKYSDYSPVMVKILMYYKYNQTALEC